MSTKEVYVLIEMDGDAITDVRTFDSFEDGARERDVLYGLSPRPSRQIILLRQTVIGS